MQCVLPSEVAKIPPTKISNLEVLLPQGHHNAWPEGSQLPLAFPSHVPTEPGQPPGVASAKSTGVEKYVGSARATLTEKSDLARELVEISEILVFLSFLDPGPPLALWGDNEVQCPELRSKLLHTSSRYTIV